MGGRGASSAAIGNMNVPYDKWGKMIDHESIPDKTGENFELGYINDEFRYTQEPFDEPITKKEILDVVESWKMDDGTYGTGDEAIYLAYKDGTFLDLTDSETGNYKKSGIVGVSVSTSDDEYVWGGEVNKKTGKVEPWTTWVSPYDEAEGKVGKSNTHSGYKTTGQYIVRIKTTWKGTQTSNGGWRPKHEIIRKSAVRPVGDRI